MSSLLSNADVLTSIGVMILAAAIVIVAIWVAVLSVKVSKLKKMVLLEQERSMDLSRQMAVQGRRRPGVQPGPQSGPGAVSPSGMPAERAAEAAVGMGAAAATAVEAERPKKPKGRKGKPTIPFGANKEAQSRAQRAYTANADDSGFDPDSIDFNKVEGLRATALGAQSQVRPQAAQPQPTAQVTAQLGTMPANAHPVRSVTPADADGVSQRRESRQRTRTRSREPHQRADAHSLGKRTTGKMAPVGQQRATAETKASFDRVGEELRSRNGGSSAWVEEDARRVVERHERAARRQRLSERRQHEQLRRQAESIVAEHHRQMSEVNNS